MFKEYIIAVPRKVDRHSAKGKSRGPEPGQYFGELWGEIFVQRPLQEAFDEVISVAKWLTTLGNWEGG